MLGFRKHHFTRSADRHRNSRSRHPRRFRLETLEERRLLAVVHGDFDGDGYQDMAVGSPGEDVGTAADAGAVNVIYGSIFGLQSYRNQIWKQSSLGDRAEAGDRFGAAVAAGDFNGDGRMDLAVGSPGEDLDGLRDTGSVHVVYGTSLGLRATARQTFYQGLGGVEDLAEEFDAFGSVLTSGDFNGDGYADLAIGVPHENLGAVNDAGAVHILYGSGSGLSVVGNQFYHQNRDGTIAWAEPYDEFGGALAAGDFNGDGLDELAIGAPGERLNRGGVTLFGAGIVHVFQGTSTGLTTSFGSQLWTKDSPGTGATPASWDFFGTSLATGDFNLDGRADLAIGTPGENNDAGAVYALYTQSLTGRALYYGRRLAQGSSSIADASQRGDLFGTSLAAGDFNGDGAADLAVGVPGQTIYSNLNAGMVHLFYASGGRHTINPLTGSYDRIYHQNTPGVNDASEPGDYFGTDTTAGDFNGDGRADLAVGVPGEDLGARRNAGLVNVLYGSADRALLVTTDQTWHQDSSAIREVAEAGDTFSGELPASVGNTISLPGAPYGDLDNMIPELHSKPGASRTLLLDFNGHRKDYLLDRRDAAVPAFDVDGDVGSFNRTERALIQDIWAHVAEDYAPFDINVITVDPEGGPSKRIAIGGRWEDWYDKAAGGVEREYALHEDDLAWVFSGNFVMDGVVRNLSSRIGTTASHEAGHSFGLDHKGDYDSTGRIDEYSNGTDEWSPIMGGGFESGRTVWTRRNVQVEPNRWVRGKDDVAVLTRKIGLRVDDHGDALSVATVLPYAPQMIMTGIVERWYDFDYFRFTLPEAGTVSIDLLVADVGPNLDSWLVLGNATTGRTIASVRPTDSLNASTTQTLAAGDYYIRVGAQRNEGSLGRYSVRVKHTTTSP